MRTDTRRLPRGSAAGPATPSEPERSGVVVASPSEPRRYELLKLLGRGGMGDVHLARDPRVGRAVALKLLRRDQETLDQPTARFLREARVQGQLDHPSVVPVYDVDRDAEGRVFFVMKKVAGETLDRVVRGLREGDAEMAQRYSLRRLLSAFQQICLTIDYAHSQGVVHRDIKLSNLMLGDFGEVYVLDWGIAKVRGMEDPTFDPITGDPPANATTQHDDVLGTVGYMAPEQIRDSRSVGPAADVYALGVVLFTLLTRQPLHGRGKAFERAESTRKGADARASLRAPELSIPPELDAVCVRATALDPEERYPTARALHDAVGRILDGDRDARLRAEVAASHLEAARHAVRRMEAGGADASEARRDALREAGRALALVPDDAEATAFLAELMFTPPEHLPPEIERETLRLSRLERLRTGAASLWAIPGFAVMLGLTLWIGVNSWTSMAWIFVPLALASATLVTVRHLELEFTVPAVMFVGFLLCFAIAASSRIVGPLVLPPLFAVAYAAIVTATHGLGRWRLLGIVMALLAVVVPWAMEAWGLGPRQYLFQNGTVVVLPGATRIESDRALVALGLAGVGTLFLVVRVMWTFSAGDMKNRRELLLLAWHFRQVASHGEADARRSPADPAAAGGEVRPGGAGWVGEALPPTGWGGRFADRRALLGGFVEEGPATLVEPRDPCD